MWQQNLANNDEQGSVAYNMNVTLFGFEKGNYGLPNEFLSTSEWLMWLFSEKRIGTQTDFV